MPRALTLALALMLLPAAVEPQDIVRGNQALTLCQSFHGFDARMSSLEDTGWTRLDPQAELPPRIVDAFAFLGLTSHMAPRSAVPARWQSIFDLSRTTTRAMFAKDDTYFHRHALFQAPEDGSVILHLTETRLSPDQRRVACRVVGLTGDSLTTVSEFRKRNILGAFSELDLRQTRGQNARSKGTIVLFDQADISQMLPGIAAPAYGLSVTTKLPSTR